MQSFFSDREQGVKLLEEVIIELADRHASRIGLPVRVEPNFIVQAYDAALSSASFHQIPISELSHRKELAHIGFWIAELKPVMVCPPRTPEAIIENAAIIIRDFFEGAQGRIAAHDKSYTRARQKYLQAATFPISESIGLEFIAHFMQAELRLKLSNPQLAPAYRAVLIQQNDNFKGIMYDAGIFDHIVRALRFHIFTPRSFATLIEAVFAFEGSPVFATDES